MIESVQNIICKIYYEFIYKSSIGSGSRIYKTTIHAGATVGKKTKLINCTIKNGVIIYSNSTLKNAFIGSNVSVYEYSLLENVSIENCSFVASHTQIRDTAIGKYCSIGPRVTISLARHPAAEFVSTHPVFYSTRKQIGITFSEENHFEEFEKVVVGNDVWIGANALIMGGISIGDGAIIGAGAIVTKDVPSYAIVGGIPAKIIRYRFDNETIEKLLGIKWWDWDLELIRKKYKMFHKIEMFLKDLRHQ
jgi:acetyltransferase-like isoleucine patch superfamily enzyme